MSWIDIVGYSAALAVLAAFCMSSIVRLRIVAILSNVLFALYGLSARLYPVFLLHSISDWLGSQVRRSRRLRHKFVQQFSGR
jgi:hypothetical protein